MTANTVVLKQQHMSSMSNISNVSNVSNMSTYRMYEMYRMYRIYRMYCFSTSAYNELFVVEIFFLRNTDCAACRMGK